MALLSARARTVKAYAKTSGYDESTFLGRLVAYTSGLFDFFSLLCSLCSGRALFNF